MSKPRDALPFPPHLREMLNPHLPPLPSTSQTTTSLPFTTLTFATSLDSSLSLAPGTRTTLSGPQSKAMTHYLRSRHAAILIGVGTALADDPGLNCRLEGVGGYGGAELTGQPRPVVLDPRGRWEFSSASKILGLVKEGKGLGPVVFVARGVRVDDSRRELLEGCGGWFVSLDLDEEGRFKWRDVLGYLGGIGLGSVMVEGGGGVINSLLGGEGLVDSVVVTIAPTWLGKGGVVVSPDRKVDGEGVAVPASRLKGVRWYPFGEDVVLCGRFKDV